MAVKAPARFDLVRKGLVRRGKKCMHTGISNLRSVITFNNKRINIHMSEDKRKEQAREAVEKIKIFAAEAGLKEGSDEYKDFLNASGAAYVNSQAQGEEVADALNDLGLWEGKWFYGKVALAAGVGVLATSAAAGAIASFFSSGSSSDAAPQLENTQELTNLYSDTTVSKLKASK